MAVVLVTGGYGFLGSHVSHALAARGDRVIIMDMDQGTEQTRKILEPVRDRLRFVNGSITNLPLILSTVRAYGVQSVVHAAAVCHAQALLDQAYTAFEVNTAGTINVLEAARLLDLDRVVYVSSVAAFAARQYEPLDEAHPIFDSKRGHPAGPYGASKAAAEIFGMAYRDAYGVDFVALRPAGIYGYGMRIPMYIKPMVENPLTGRPCTFSTGAGLRRSFTYVKDCVDAVLRALDANSSKLQRRVFVIAEGEMYSIETVANLVRRLIPGADITVGAELTEYEQRRLEHSGELDITAAREQLGFSPRYSLEDGLRDYIETYRRLEAI